MAVSHSRTDPSSAADVAGANFGISRKGFDPGEVRSFLQAVAAELRRAQDRERELEAELDAARQRRSIDPSELNEETVTALLGEETARVLATAREASGQIRARAEDGAARLLREAQEDAGRLRTEGEIEAARRRQDAARDAEGEIEAAKQHGRQMVNEAREYRERVLADISKRKEQARQQLQELAGGRERLVQAFERARLVSGDVLAEFQELSVELEDELASGPPTEPVPVVPAPRAIASSIDADDDTNPTDDDDDDEEFIEPAESDARKDDDLEIDSATEEFDPIRFDPADAVRGLSDNSPINDDPAPDESVEAEMNDLANGIELPTKDATDDAPVLDEPADDSSGGAEATVIQLADHAEPEPLAPVVALFGEEGARPTTDDPSNAGDAPTKPSVDDLFARLKASRPAGVADAVLADQRDGSPSPVTTAIDDEVTAADNADENEPANDPFAERDELLVELDVSIARRMKRVLADEQNDVLDVLRRKPAVTSIDQLLPVEDAHRASYREAVNDDVAVAAEAGAFTQTDDQTSAMQTLKDEGVVEAVLGKIDTELIAPLRQRLDRAIRDSSGDNSEIANHVRAIYREVKSQRLDDLATEMSLQAYGHGRFVAIAPGTPLVWHAAPDCPDLRSNGAAGVVLAGSAFPSGDRFPPTHSACGCLVTPTR